MGVICDISASLSSILSSCNPLTLLPRITIYFFKNLVSATHMSFLSENILKVFFSVTNNYSEPCEYSEATLKCIFGVLYLSLSEIS